MVGSDGWGRFIGIWGERRRIKKGNGGKDEKEYIWRWRKKRKGRDLKRIKRKDEEKGRDDWKEWFELKKRGRGKRNF